MVTEDFYSQDFALSTAKILTLFRNITGPQIFDANASALLPAFAPRPGKIRLTVCRKQILQFLFSSKDACDHER
jgi:hypothetical protein